MRRIAIAVVGSLVVAGIVGLGIAVAGLASTALPGGVGQTTSETTTSETTTTEEPKTTKYRAVLITRAQVPRPKGARPGAGGSFRVDLTDSSGSYSIAWTLTFRGLTGPARRAHIHRGTTGRAGPVLVSLCSPCRSGRTGKASVAKSVATAFEAGRTYVDVHTARNPAGEIRGQIRKAG